MSFAPEEAPTGYPKLVATSAAAFGNLKLPAGDYCFALKYSGGTVGQRYAELAIWGRDSQHRPSCGVMTGDPCDCESDLVFDIVDEPNWLQASAEEATRRILAMDDATLGPAGRLLRRALVADQDRKKVTGEVPTSFDCDLCEDEKLVAKNFSLEATGAPEVVACPRCAQSFYEERYGTLEDARKDIAENLLNHRLYECSRDEIGALADRARILAQAAEVYVGVLETVRLSPAVRW